jgi:solute carrier family 10 (sodium/bile acid cotransporter), member 7
VAPTTLGVGVALVRSCKGNEGLALLLTVGTNFLGVITMPFIIKLLLRDVKGVSVNVALLGLFVKLVITILAPTVVGKVRQQARCWTRSCVHRTALPSALSKQCMAGRQYGAASPASAWHIRTGVALPYNAVCEA